MLMKSRSCPQAILQSLHWNKDKDGTKTIQLAPLKKCLIESIGDFSSVKGFPPKQQGLLSVGTVIISYHLFSLLFYWFSVERVNNPFPYHDS